MYIYKTNSCLMSAQQYDTGAIILFGGSKKTTTIRLNNSFRTTL